MAKPNHLPRKLFDAVLEMNSANTHADFISAVAAALSRLIPADLCVVHVLDRRHQRLIDRTLPENPYTEEEVAYYKANSEQNPLVEYYHRTGDGTLILSADNTYTGTTTIQNGTLSLTGSPQATSAIEVASGGTLSLDIELPTAASNAAVTLGGSVLLTGTPVDPSYTTIPGSPLNSVTASISPSESGNGKLFARLEGTTP